MKIFKYLFLFILLTNSLSAQEIFISGGNRGIGLALVQLYLSKGFKVYATYKNEENSCALKQIENKNLHILKVDFLESDAVRKVTKFLNGASLDVVIHNASYFPYQANKLQSLNAQDWGRAFKVNVIFPIQLSYQLQNSFHHAGQKKIIFISSRRGSNTINKKDDYRGRYGYRSSKAALNSAAVGLSQDLREKGVAVLILHPGRVATKITSFDGMSPSKSAHLIAAQVQKLSIETSGRFISVETGDEIPW